MSGATGSWVSVDDDVLIPPITCPLEQRLGHQLLRRWIHVQIRVSRQESSLVVPLEQLRRLPRLERLKHRSPEALLVPVPELAGHSPTVVFGVDERSTEEIGQLVGDGGFTDTTLA